MMNPRVLAKKTYVGVGVVKKKICDLLLLITILEAGIKS